MENLFFELASENRFTILRILSGETLKMQALARRLDITATEAFRQLQRLSDVSLVQRLPDGTFTITQYGKLVFHLSTPYGFISEHREYFLTHDIFGLPGAFLNRLGELSGARLIEDTVESVNTSIRIFLEAEEYAWGMSERGGGPDHLDPLMEEQIQKGLEFKLMIPENQLPAAIPQIPSRSMQVKGHNNPPAIMAVSEKEAIIFFPYTNGRIDYTGFHGKNPVFHKWVKDLFLYLWDMGK